MNYYLQLSCLLFSGSALQAQPEPSTAHTQSLHAYAKGVLTEMRGNEQAALPHFLQADKLGPSSSFYLTRKISTAQLTNGDLSSASSTRRQFLQQHPNHLTARLDYVDFLLNTTPGDAITIELAEKHLNAAPSAQQFHPSLLQRKIRFYLDHEKTETAQNLFLEALDQPSDHPRHWQLLASLSQTLTPDDESRESITERIYQELERTGLQQADIARALSDFHRSNDRKEKAVAVLRAHLSLHPSSHSIKTRLGILLLNHSRDEEALIELHESLLIQPDQHLAHKVLSRFYTESSQMAKALPHRAAMLRIRGGDIEDYLDLADSYLEVDQFQHAIHLLEKARHLDPDDLSISAKLAIALAASGESNRSHLIFSQINQEAATGSTQALALLTPEFREKFALILQSTGQFTEAEAHLRAAIKDTPAEEKSASARRMRHLAELWIAQSKNLAAARSLMRRADQLAPENPPQDGSP